MTWTLVGLDPGQTVGLCALVVPDNLDLSAIVVLGSRVVHAPGQTKKLESRVELDRVFCDKLAAIIAGFAPDVVAMEDPIDARPFWQRQKGASIESGETRYRQGCYADIAVQAAPRAVPLFAYPVRGRKGEGGWHGNRTAKAITTISRTTMRAWGWKDEVSEHELMACGVALHYLNRRLLDQLRIRAAS
jgi:Holliday junction resolvasome RuvABC endonuclease subunit